MARLGRRWPAPTLRGPQLLEILSDVTVYNVVTDYGATGNGTTSDSTAIQNAINAAQSAGGGIVYMPPGTYLLTAGLVIGKTGSTYYSGITLLGAGEASTTLLVAQNATFTPLTVTGNSAAITSYGYHRLSDFGVLMASPASSGTTPGISVEYCLFTHLTDISITHFATGLYVTGTSGLRCERLYIPSGSTVPTVYGVYLDGATQNANAYFFHCSATFSPTTPNTTIGFYSYGAHLADLYIHFCEADQCAYGFVYDGITASQPVDQLDVQFYQCVADQCANGVVVQNLTAAGGMVNIDGVWFAPRQSSAIGITVRNASGVQIRAAELYNGTGVDKASCWGVYLVGAADCSVTQCVLKGAFIENILLDGASYCTVFGNAIVGSISAGQAGIAALNSSNHSSIVGNTIRGISGTSTMGYGVYIDGTSSKIAVSNNVVDTGTVTTPLDLVSGSSNIDVNHNIGF